MAFMINTPLLVTNHTITRKNVAMAMFPHRRTRVSKRRYHAYMRDMGRQVNFFNGRHDLMMCSVTGNVTWDD